MSMGSFSLCWRWWWYSLEEVDGVSSSRNFFDGDEERTCREFSLEAMDDEEVALVDGVFDGAFGALGDEMDAFLVECHGENDIFSFDSMVRLNALKLKNSTNFVGSRKLCMIWSFGFLKERKRCKISFICEDTLTIVWNLKNSSEFCKRESDEFILDHERD
ncbi:hypothetical protein Tco_0682172 [Tanacetum coccineum]|uniref:Uncharacterized protein n=1 Tax=Tanacetum coccineum TaxID=301880 RepID=A0ABQ4XSB1_9ASTR